MNQKEILGLTLNTLLHINHDRVHGYANAIASVENQKNSSLLKLFKQYAAVSCRFAAHWEQTIRSLGIEPVGVNKHIYEVFRGWVDFTLPYDGYTNKSILHYCARGEKAAHESYKDVLLYSASLPSNIQDEIRYQKMKIHNAQISIVTMAIYVSTFDKTHAH